jgi:restriction system protein
VGRTGDEGIDGIIKEDRLLMLSMCRQAKECGATDVQRFAGALRQRARKGVFMTTSSFTPDARSYAANLQTTIVLIDGKELAELMIDHGVGVSEAAMFKVLKLDEDYFAEDLGG